MFKKLFSQPFFRDGKTNALLVVGGFLLLVHIVNFMISIQTQDIKVPIRYTGYNPSLGDTGQWSSLFVLVVFGVAAYGINSALSIKVFKLKKALSVVLLSLNIVIMIFLILVSRALLNLQ